MGVSLQIRLPAPLAMRGDAPCGLRLGARIGSARRLGAIVLAICAVQAGGVRVSPEDIGRQVYTIWQRDNIPVDARANTGYRLMA